MKVVIVGGGAAGFFVANNLVPKNKNTEVFIFEKSNSVLGKVKVSGGGRCNVTHHCFDAQRLVKNYPRGEKELLGLFQQFNPMHTIQWFAEKGVEIVAEQDGRMFPKSNTSQTIVDCLTAVLHNSNVRLFHSEAIIDISILEKGFVLQTSKGKTIEADKLVITTGSSFAMWELLRKIGHTVQTPVPSLFTFNIKDTRIEGLQGISVERALVEIEACSLKESGPLLITHWGLSGPAILKLSAWGARKLNALQYRVSCKVNWISVSKDLCFNSLMAHKQANGNKKVTNSNPFFLPSRLWNSFLSYLKIDGNWADCKKQQLKLLAENLTGSVFEVNGKSTFKEEFVTCGGISLKEVNMKTMESKLVKGLYFAGEVLDIDAITGGFNFQAAWSTAWAVSESISKQ